jgi:hypothetical protein
MDFSRRRFLQLTGAAALWEPIIKEANIKME